MVKYFSYRLYISPVSPVTLALFQAWSKALHAPSLTLKEKTMTVLSQLIQQTILSTNLTHQTTFLTSCLSILPTARECCDLANTNGTTLA